jgi:hypothetical protein
MHGTLPSTYKLAAGNGFDQHRFGLSACCSKPAKPASCIAPTENVHVLLKLQVMVDSARMGSVFPTLSALLRKLAR